MAEGNGNGNGFELAAGPATLKATGGVVINVLLALLLVGASFYGVWTINQQTLLVQAEHRAILASVADLRTASENVFLSSVLSNEQKRDLPRYVQDRAKEIVERRAQNITEDRR